MKITDGTIADTSWIRSKSERLGAPIIVNNRRLVDLYKLPSRVAWQDRARVGFTVYQVGEPGVLELLAIFADPPRQGIGSALLSDAIDIARRHGTQKVIVHTTNDNIDALCMHQRRGFKIVDWRIGGFADTQKGTWPGTAVEPVIGNYGIEVRDVVRLEQAV
ncbi:MAG: GNAT family N-acetyltransferase [Hyphomicrobiaceae bacterium]